MKRVKKTVSMMGLILRKTMYKQFILVAGAFALYWIITPIAVTITALILSAVIMIMPFERKGRRAMFTIKRFAFDSEDLKVIFGFMTFLELHMMVLLLRFAYILRVGIECGFAEFGVSPLNTVKLRQAEILFGTYPRVAMNREIFFNIIFFIVSIIVAKVVNRDEE